MSASANGRSSLIPEQAQASLENLFLRHLEEALKTNAHGEWELESLARVEEIKAQEFIILTISSYDLRTFVLLHFSKNANSTRYVSSALDTTPHNLSDAAFYDFLGEVGNKFCGAFKRELGRVLPHLGMSTPNRLPHESLIHLQNLCCGYDTHVKVSTPDEIIVYASLYVSTYGQEEFRLDEIPLEVEPVETGELEMF
jgi:hypothetical protein